MEEKNLESKFEEGVQYMKATEHMMADEKKSLESLLQENLELTRGLVQDMKKVKRSMMWRTIMSWVWILLFIIPLIFSVIYLPSILSDGLSGIIGGVNINDLISGLK